MTVSKHFRHSLLCGLGILIGCAVLLPEAYGQRPFRAYDPFYRGETAKRAFFDGYAVTAELSYRPAGTLQGQGISGGPSISAANALVLSFRIDYELAPQLDLSAIMDASGGLDGRAVKLSWLALKHYWHVDGSDYAIRVAVDPITDGGLGFRQTDVAFVSSTALTPMMGTNFAVGWRRVRVGYEQLYPEAIGERDIAGKWSGPAFVYMRAVGQEAHLMMSYNLFLNPAESHLFLSVLTEAGEYDVMETPLIASPVVRDMDQGTTRYTGGIIWLWAGFQWNRPSYQVAPYLSLPITRWGHSMGKTHFGLRFTVR